MIARPLMTPDIQEYPHFQENLPSGELRDGKYCVRFAQNRDELNAALRLRFEVFNLELGEGLQASRLTGRDLDEYDAACHHLIVLETPGNQVVGTYRLQTGVMAAAGREFYSASEFDLSSLPSELLKDAVELGRACIAKSHRNTQALYLLWKGLAAYLTHNRKRFLFGCCSLTSQDPREGKLMMELLEREGFVTGNYRALPRPEYRCYDDDFTVAEPFEVKLPKLFRAYLRFGAKVCGPPAIDREFKTIDFLVLFDVHSMDSQARQMFFGG